MNQRVIIRSSEKDVNERYKRIIGKAGTIIKISGSAIGVLIDGEFNSASSYGTYWFTRNELKFIENESEDNKMEGYKHIAIVNLLEDCNKKDYAFALYDEDIDVLNSIQHNYPALAVVNASRKDNRILGIVKDIMSVEDYYSIDANRGRKITAEVVGFVNMDRYISREEEKVRLAELEKKKAAIEKEIEAEINKRKSVEYYEEMAKQYSDNPRLAELVMELKNLGA
jgi:hypothetical protein